MSTDKTPALVWHTTLHQGRVVTWTTAPGGEPDTGRLVSILDPQAGPAQLVRADGTTEPLPAHPAGLIAVHGGPHARPLLTDAATLLPHHATLLTDVAAGAGTTHHDLTNPDGIDPDPLVGYAGFGALHDLTEKTVITYRQRGLLPPADDTTPRGRPLWRRSTATAWTRPNNQGARTDLHTRR